MTIKKDLNIYSVNPLYLVFSKVNKYFNGNKYLKLFPINVNKKKSEKLWIKIRDLIRSITKNFDDYDEKYMNTDGNLP